VLNLVPNKARAFAEILRVLRPAAHFCVSDIVATGELSEPIAMRRLSTSVASPAPYRGGITCA
jgi:ubiquinone/menaquinone biosynthesis C-methylase UbiE